MSELRDAVASAIFGHWRNVPRLPDDQLAQAWADLAPAFKEAWLASADLAIAAYKKVEEQQMVERFGRTWQTKLAYAVKQMEMMP